MREFGPGGRERSSGTSWPGMPNAGVGEDGVTAGSFGEVFAGSTWRDGAPSRQDETRFLPPRLAS